jgi:outer membrane lipoprotein LolB
LIRSAAHTAGTGRLRGPAIVVAFALVLAACAMPAPVTMAPMAPIVPLSDTAFDVDGRLSARRGDDGIAVGFSWRHDPPRDALTVTTPLGQVVAELAGDAARHEVELVLADGRREVAADWPALTSRALGFSLPVAGLSAWVRGAPHAASAWTVEADASGRAGVLRQDGWEIVFGYADDGERRPARLRLVGSETEMRIAIDRWH